MHKKEIRTGTHQFKTYQFKETSSQPQWDNKYILHKGYTLLCNIFKCKAWDSKCDPVQTWVLVKKPVALLFFGFLIRVSCNVWQAKQERVKCCYL